MCDLNSNFDSLKMFWNFLLFSIVTFTVESFKPDDLEWVDTDLNVTFFATIPENENFKVSFPTEHV